MIPLIKLDAISSLNLDCLISQLNHTHNNFMGSFGDYEWSFHNCSCLLKGKSHFPFAGSVNKLQMSFLFVSLTCTDQITKLKHTQPFRLLLLCSSAIPISQFDTWHKPILNSVSVFCLFSWSKKVF